MVVWPVVLHTTVMIVFWLMSLTCSGSCPENSALREALTCLHNLTDGDNSKISISPADIKQTKSFCENGNFQDSVRCLRGLHQTCRDPLKLEMLKKYADPDAWEAGFNRLCNSMSLYVKHGDCIIKQNEVIQKCIESKKDIQVSSRAGVSYTFDKNEKEYVENVCGYFQILIHCYSNQLGTHCGADIQAVLSDFNSGLTPPICRDFSFAALRSAGSLPDRSAVTLFACVVTFLAAWITPS